MSFNGVPGALVTGGSKGIGAAIAHRLSRDGYPVVIAARSRGSASEAARRISEATGNRVHVAVADVSDRAAAAALVAEAVRQLGAVGILVNNVGDSAFGTLEDITDAQWDHAFATKFFAAVTTMRAIIAHMRGLGGGAIVNIAGTGGVQVTPAHMAGGAANIALIHLTKAVSQQVGRDGIRVNAVSPGPTESDRWQKAISGMKGDGEVDDFVRRTIADTPLGRVGLPEDIADMVGFLVSEQAKFVTGQHMIVDGGRSRAL